MASTPMTVQDLKNRYEGNLNDRFSETFLQTKVEDAIALIEGDYPTVATRLESGVLSGTNYKRIVSDAVLRQLRNLDGYASENEGGAGYTLRAAVASGDLWFTDRDIFTLTGLHPTEKNRKLPGTASIGVDAGW